MNVPFAVDEVTLETVGAVVSIVTELADEVVETPLRVETAVIEYGEAELASDAVVHDQAPVVELAEQVLPEFVPFTLSWIVDPPVAVPLNVGVVSFVMLSVVLNPVSLAASRSGVVGVESVYVIVT